MIYTNGVKINISDIIRLTFIDNLEGQFKNVAEICMSMETLKTIRDGMTNCIEDHESRLAKMAKSS